MHLGNGAITPECGLVALGVAAAGVGVAAVAVRGAIVDRNRAATAGALTAMVFAAQMFNVPILPFSSAHLIGGVLLAWVLGPPLGLLCMTAVLSVQALLLGDGGLLAWGTNVINMGLVPAMVVAAADRLGWRRQPAQLPALGAAALLATLAGAALLSLEVAVGRGAAQLDGWSSFAWRMVAAHALSGVLEAGVSMACVWLLEKSSQTQTAALVLRPRAALALAAASVALAILSIPAFGLASPAPDAYQSTLSTLAQSGHAIGSLESAQHLTGLAAAVQSWQDALNQTVSLPDAVLALLGVSLAGLVAWLGAGQWSGRTTFE